ncbi:MAG: polysaccharide biosynthesis tyrosine autokinase [Planctomycetes bacterium]|nr:polysaccharide biosynthesis tyrosine autokinase [Planctomycetota bacterium]
MEAWDLTSVQGIYSLAKRYFGIILLLQILSASSVVAYTLLKPDVYEISFDVRVGTLPTEDTEEKQLITFLIAKAQSETDSSLLDDKKKFMTNDDVLSEVLAEVDPEKWSEDSISKLSEEEQEARLDEKYSEIEKLRSNISCTDASSKTIHVSMIGDDPKQVARYSEILRSVITKMEIEELADKNSKGLSKNQELVEATNKELEEISSRANQKSEELESLRKLDTMFTIESEVDMAIEERNFRLERLRSQGYGDNWPPVVQLMRELDFLGELKLTTGEDIEDKRREAPEELAPLVERWREYISLRESASESASLTAAQIAARIDLVSRELEDFLSRKHVLETRRSNSNQSIEQYQRLISTQQSLLTVQNVKGIARDISYQMDSKQFLFAGLIALLIAASVIVYAEGKKEVFRSIQEVEAVTGVEVLGYIPKIHEDSEKTRERQKKHPDKPAMIVKGYRVPEQRYPIICHYGSDPFVSDRFRILKTNIINRLERTSGISLLITSHGPQEGKSTCTGNLAVAFAEMGFKTVICSCNLRRPTLEVALDIEAREGMAEVLRGERNWRELIRSTEILNLSILPAGEKLPEDSTRLIYTKEFEKFFSEIRQQYEIVILDSPPLHYVADAVLLSSVVDATIIICSLGGTKPEALKHAITQVQKAHGNLLGLVVNYNRYSPKGGANDVYGYGYGYGYGYASSRSEEDSEVVAPEASAPRSDEVLVSSASDGEGGSSSGADGSKPSSNS